MQDDSNKFVIERCKTCGKSKASNGEWFSGAIETESFTNVCFSYIQHENIVSHSYIYNYPHNRIFCLATKSNDPLETHLAWFSIQDTQCPICEQYQSLQIDPSWLAIVELKATENVLPLLWLEQQIRSANMNLTANDFTQTEDGAYCFTFDNKPTAFRFVAFIKSLLAVNIEEENTCQGYTDAHLPINQLIYHVSCPNVWKDDLIQEKGRYLLCLDASSEFTFIDVDTCQIYVKSAEDFWKDPPNPLSKSSLKLCIVEDVLPIGVKIGKYQKMDILVSADGIYYSGHCHFRIATGSTCLCYCLDDILIPVREVVSGKRQWYVKTLGAEPSEELLRVLERDPELRHGITLFAEEEVPASTIDELLVNLGNIVIEKA